MRSTAHCVCLPSTPFVETTSKKPVDHRWRHGTRRQPSRRPSTLSDGQSIGPLLGLLTSGEEMPEARRPPVQRRVNVSCPLRLKRKRSNESPKPRIRTVRFLATIGRHVVRATVDPGSSGWSVRNWSRTGNPPRREVPHTERFPAFARALPCHAMFRVHAARPMHATVSVTESTRGYVDAHPAPRPDRTKAADVQPWPYQP